METLSDALKRRDSMQVIWSLLNPAPEFQSLYNDFMRYWNKIERDRQLQIWYFLKRKIDTKQPLDPNPFEALKSCTPYPINYNGDSRINRMMKSDTKMVKAFHQGSFGVYELMDARLWHMTRIEPLNFKDPKTPSNPPEGGGKDTPRPPLRGGERKCSEGERRIGGSGIGG